MAEVVTALALLVKIGPDPVRISGGANVKRTLGESPAYNNVCPDCPHPNSGRTANFES